MSLSTAGALGGGLISGIAGMFMGQPKTTTTTNTPTYTGAQQNLQTLVSNSLEDQINNPQDVYAGARAGAIDQVNTNTSGLEKRLQSQFSGRGFGRSGQVVTNTRAVESNRVGQIGTLDAQFAGMQQDYETNLLKQAQQFGFTNPGNTGTSTSPDMSAAYGMSSGISTLTTLLALNKMMQGGGGSYGGGVDGSIPAGVGDPASGALDSLLVH